MTHYNLNLKLHYTRDVIHNHDDRKIIENSVSPRAKKERKIQIKKQNVR